MLSPVHTSAGHVLAEPHMFVSSFVNAHCAVFRSHVSSVHAFPSLHVFCGQEQPFSSIVILTGVPWHKSYAFFIPSLSESPIVHSTDFLNILTAFVFQ